MAQPPPSSQPAWKKCLQVTGGKLQCPVGPLDQNRSDPSDLFAAAPSQNPQHSTNTALQRPCFYLGVKKQRGGSQVLLLEGTHRVRHLPLLHPAGQQHRGLRTQHTAKGHTQEAIPLLTQTFLPLLLHTTNYDPRYPQNALGMI